MRQSLYDNAEQLNSAFAARIVDLLQAGIDASGRASLLVSGGRTPVALFQTLSTSELDWSKVDVSLADERWVEADDAASNEKLVRENLLQNNAAAATFYGLKTAAADANDGVAECTSRRQAMSTPIDVLILGMGEDGHTASLFPCSEQIQQGLDVSRSEDFIAVQPTTAPNQRMSLTLKALLQSKHIFLHLTGERKREVLDAALAGDDASQMPIRAVLHNADVELVWAP